jgi:IS30 family transposase
MKKKPKLQRAERLEIAILLKKGYSMRSIAETMDRSPNTISYEITHNKTNGVYDPRKAHTKARVSKRVAKFQWKKINQDKDLENYITEKLQQHWNPDEISGKMKREKMPFYASKTAIYDWLYSSRGQRYCKYLYTKRHYKKPRRTKKTERVMIPNRVSIDKRFRGANTRERFGHWENDAVVSGKKGKGSLAVSQERKGKLIRIAKCASLSPQEHSRAHQRITDTHKVLSHTFDNGIENKKHQLLGVPTFFCDPYSSWQKGGVENANKMIRRYIPKGSDISQFSVAYIQWVEDIINNKPRKSLGYRSALEVSTQAGIIKSESVLIEG